MISDARNGHVSPGIYTEERDVTYSVKSLGITSLGLVGETLYGPAFQNIEIKNWTEFVDYFGGTSPLKYKNGNPKYELPYIAKSYLEASNRLNVVRVLGLSGYNAGPVWVIKDNSGNPVVILRSKMEYGDNNENICEAPSESTPKSVVSAISISAYEETVYNSVCINQENGNVTSGNTLSGDTYFHLTVHTTGGKYKSKYEYNLTLDPSHSNYIYNVLSNNPENGGAPIYIDSVFENVLSGGICTSAQTVLCLSAETITTKKYYKVTTVTSPTPPTEDDTQDETSGGTQSSGKSTKNTNANYIYELEITVASDSAKKYEGDDIVEDSNKITLESSSVYNEGDIIFTEKTETLDLYADYKEGYRPAITPWIVSEASVTSGTTGLEATMKKLFRFITISDGNIANTQVKVSIQNIKIEDGTFDVVVRDFYDTDASPVILEKFSKCNLTDGDSNFIAYKIGTSDGGYVSKSKYILVEMSDNTELYKSVPAGFLGYPIPNYSGSGVCMTYNTKFDPTKKVRKQYFGISDISRIDVDMLSYKGRLIYDGLEDNTFARNGFHMDSAIDSATTCYVDGVGDYKFTTVSRDKVTSHTSIPRLINANYINNTLYSDIKTRKFTVCFYGGFDGWDVNRENRTNTDDYKSSKYNVDNSTVFERYYDKNGLNLSLNLPNTAITSDYYAYLAGYRTFANPQDIDINLFATPGINWDENTLLTEEVIDMIEDSEDGRGGDALYIMASPNNIDSTELADRFTEKEINSSYACTYAPWVMFYDSSNKKYLDLPVTKDVVRNMAATDNNSYPWFAPAGMERGNVNCVKAEYKTTLANEDDLYENRINPVKTFAQDGVKIWGNKTAYNVDSPLNRINVRRLMIRVKKLVTSAAKNLIFTQYDDTLEKQFRGLIDPILADVKSNRGISDYRIVTEVTPETKDQHILPAKILIKPTPALEYISISFVVYPESVSFDEN
jgi:hypothetical protein